MPCLTLVIPKEGSQDSFGICTVQLQGSCFKFSIVYSHFSGIFLKKASEVSETHPFTHQTGGNFPKTQPGAAFWDSWPVAKRAFCCRYESKGTLGLGGFCCYFFGWEKGEKLGIQKKRCFGVIFLFSFFAPLRPFCLFGVPRLKVWNLFQRFYN